MEDRKKLAIGFTITLSAPAQGIITLDNEMTENGSQDFEKTHSLKFQLGLLSPGRTISVKLVLVFNYSKRSIVSKCLYPFLALTYANHLNGIQLCVKITPIFQVFISLIGFQMAFLHASTTLNQFSL